MHSFFVLWKFLIKKSELCDNEKHKKILWEDSTQKNGFGELNAK